MRFDVCTIFPEMFDGFLNTSIMRRARDKGIINSNLVNFRDFSTDIHKRVDDTPYGGGGGMVLKPDPLFSAVQVLSQNSQPHVILLTPQGIPFTQQKAEELSEKSHLLFICGRYEGYDERIAEHLAAEEISIGDYVLTGGELPAMIIMDSVTRLLDGVLGNQESHKTDSFSQRGLLGFPQYTKPRSFQGSDVPEVLLSGDHAAIDEWRKVQSLRRTWERRPDLLNLAKLDIIEQDLVEKWNKDRS